MEEGPSTQIFHAATRDAWRDAFAAALYTEKRAELEGILRAENATQHYALPIDWAAEILEPNAALGHLVVAKPLAILPVLEEALQVLQERALQAAPDAENMTLKAHVHARLFGFGSMVESVHRQLVPRAPDVGRLVSLSATVIRTGMAKLLETRRKYSCRRCQKSFWMFADREQYNAIPRPVRCLARDPAHAVDGDMGAENAPPAVETEERCAGAKFVPEAADVGAMPLHCRDYQEMTLQEKSDQVGMRALPRSIAVLLENDLVDCCKAGDDVTVTGIVLQRWKPLSVGERCDVEVVLLANHVQVKNEEKASAVLTDEHKREIEQFWRRHADRVMQGRDEIVASICPGMYGLALVKLAVALVLAGGVPQTGPAGVRVRGESHLLLVGDPGTGKSQFLQFATKLVPRSVLTTGFGSTNAGLTVAAVRDSGEWVLEAGALVLADRGLCCIDEFGSIRGQDKTAIHEAMEQQTISVAKAGMVCKLGAQCSVIAATNPKGRYDPGQSLSVNLALASPLLSRFDLVLVLMDTQNDAWDERVSQFILEAECDQPLAAPEAPQPPARPRPVWSCVQLRRYFAYVKSEFAPVLTPDAEQVLTAYYTLQRQADGRNAARTTIRLLESLIRLSQAHARLTFQRKATVRDATVAVALMDLSMQTTTAVSAVHSNGPSLATTVQSTFPDNADADYCELERRILSRLGLDRLLPVSEPCDAPVQRFAPAVAPPPPPSVDLRNVREDSPQPPQDFSQVPSSDGSLSPARTVASWVPSQARTFEPPPVPRNVPSGTGGTPVISRDDSNVSEVVPDAADCQMGPSDDWANGEVIGDFPAGGQAGGDIAGNVLGHVSNHAATLAKSQTPSPPKEPPVAPVESDPKEFSAMDYQTLEIDLDEFED